MSTKIYTGFKFRNPHLLVIHHQIQAFRKELKALVLEKCSRLVAEMATHRIDRLAMGMKVQEPSSDCPLACAWSKLNEEKRKIDKTQERNPIFDFDFELAIFPLSEDKVLGMYFTEQEDFRKLWLSKWFVEEYGYWDNTDKPDELSEKDWERRCRDWDKALPDYCAVPSLNGYGADCTEKYYPVVHAAEALKYIPNRRQRVRSIAKDRLWMQRSKRKKLVEVENFWKELREFSEWFKSGKGKKAMKAMEAKVRAKIPRRITKSLLLGK